MPPQTANTPQTVASMRTSTKLAKEGANRWLDNCYALLVSRYQNCGAARGLVPSGSCQQTPAAHAFLPPPLHMSFPHCCQAACTLTYSRAHEYPNSRGAARSLTGGHTRSTRSLPKTASVTPWSTTSREERCLLIPTLYQM